jgi:hypothetical protein
MAESISRSHLRHDLDPLKAAVQNSFFCTSAFLHFRRRLGNQHLPWPTGWGVDPRIRPAVLEPIFTSNRSPRTDLHRERVGTASRPEQANPLGGEPGSWFLGSGAGGDSRPQIATADRKPWASGFSTTCASGVTMDMEPTSCGRRPRISARAKPGGERKYPTAFLGDRDRQQDRGKPRSSIRNAVERALSGFLPLSFSILYVHPMRQFTAKPLFYPFRWVHGALLSLIQ